MVKFFCKWSKVTNRIVLLMSIVVIKDGNIAQTGPRAELLPGLLGSADAASAACSVLANKVEGVRR